MPRIFEYFCRKFVAYTYTCECAANFAGLPQDQKCITVSYFQPITLPQEAEPKAATDEAEQSAPKVEEPEHDDEEVRLLIWLRALEHVYVPPAVCIQF